jgi:hypothetical protein
MEKESKIPFFIFRKLEPLTPLSLLKLMKESNIPGEDSLTLLICRSSTSVSTAKNSKQLYLLFSNSQTFFRLHRKKTSQVAAILPIQKEKMDTIEHSFINII